MKWLKIDDDTLINVGQIVSIERWRSHERWGESIVDVYGFTISYSHSDPYRDMGYKKFKFDSFEMMVEAHRLICDKITEGDEIIFNDRL